MLDLSYNKIKTLDPGTFKDTRNLLHLDLSFNEIHQLQPYTFSGLSRLRKLVLTGNHLHLISPNSTIGLSSLKKLDLSSQDIFKLVSYDFIGMTSLRYLSLKDNKIEKIEDDAFSELGNLTTLNLEGNPLLKVIPAVVFEPLHLTVLTTDRYSFCCAANYLNSETHAKTCTPSPDEFSTCADLLANKTLQIAIWVLAFVNLIGNGVALLRRCIIKREEGVENVLVVNLSIADSLMGAYLLIVASVDVHYRGKYVIHADHWTQGPLCTLAGILSFISSEMSVFTLALMTIDRVIAIVYAFKLNKLNKKKLRVILPIAWATVVASSLVPIWNRGMYGASGVCLPFSFRQGGELQSLVFLSINLFVFVFIFIGYMMIYNKMKQSRRLIETYGNIVDSPTQERELIFLKKISMVILSDFVCWVPMIIIKYLALTGSKIAPEVAAWMAVFVLPLNSALNPHMYTLSTVGICSPRKKAPPVNLPQTNSNVPGTGNARNGHRPTTRVTNAIQLSHI
jgi:hypothetical protein